MKVAYISVYRDQTGYGYAAQNIIRCLDHAGVDVVPIWVTLNTNPRDPHQRIIELENEHDLNDVDVIIQQTLPQYFYKVANIPCVGIFFWETSHFKGSNWQYSCNMMDQVWVNTVAQMDACIDSGVNSDKIRTYRFPYHFEDPDPSLETIDFGSAINGKYKFYTISEVSHRKNITGLLVAFFNQFTARQNVALIIRGYVSGSGPDESLSYMKNLLQDVRNQIGRRGEQLPPVVFIPNHLSDRDLQRVHKTCDCFVSLSRGEGECLPIVDAVNFDNSVIAPCWSGPKELLYGSTHRLLSVTPRPVVGMHTGMPNLYNYDEKWMDPSISEASTCMNRAYTEWNRDRSKVLSDNVKSRKVTKGLYGYDTVGKQLVEKLEKLAMKKQVVEV